MSQIPIQNEDNTQASDTKDENGDRNQLLQLLQQQYRPQSADNASLTNAALLMHQANQANPLLNQQLNQQLLMNNALMNIQNPLSGLAGLSPGLSLFQNSMPGMQSWEALAAHQQQQAALTQIATSNQFAQPSALQQLPGPSVASILPQQNNSEALEAEAAEAAVLRRGDEKGKRDPIHAFPTRLHEILANPEYNQFIAWLPHGRAFKILNKTLFEKKVIPHHFRHARYASFMRQVNGWGFKRLTEGPDHNAYYHEFFLRDYPQLCWKMQRPADAVGSTAKKAKKNSRKKASLVESEQILEPTDANGHDDQKPADGAANNEHNDAGDESESGTSTN